MERFTEGLKIVSKNKNGEYNVTADFTTDMKPFVYTDAKTGERKIIHPTITLPTEYEVTGTNQQTAPVIPTDQKGNMLFEQAPVEVTVGELKKAFNGDEKLLNESVDAQIKTITEKLKKRPMEPKTKKSIATAENTVNIIFFARPSLKLINPNGVDIVISVCFASLESIGFAFG